VAAFIDVRATTGALPC